MKILIIMTVVIFLSFPVYGQDTQRLLDQVAQVYTGSDVSKNSLIGGFSLWGLMGGVLFGSIGFVAFIYGKRNAEFRPMIIGLLLMGYPYFVRGTIALYVIGVVLTTVLFVFRE